MSNTEILNCVLKKSTHPRGFVLPFTMFITVLILFVTTGSLALLSKQQYFSRIYGQTQTAYYAADDAIACANMIDDTYVANDGLGIFPSVTATAAAYPQSVLDYMNAKPGATLITLGDITCGQSPIFVSGGAPVYNPTYTVSSIPYVYNFKNPVTNLPDTETGVTVSYNMHMDLGLDPADGVAHLYRCAKVTVNKTASFRQIVAQGYSNCNGSGNAVERAVVNTTIIQ